MAGLQSYVLGNQSPPLAQPTRTDRLTYATNAKVSARKPTANSVSTPRPFQTAPPALQYTSKSTDPRNEYPTSWYPQQQQPATTAQKGIFDDTLSGFDYTESDAGFDKNKEMPGNAAGNNQLARTEDDYDEIEDSEDSGRYPERLATPRGDGISGRFHQPPQTHQQHANMELRPCQNGSSREEQLNSSKKRSRLEGPSDDFRSLEERVQNRSGKHGVVGVGKFDASSSGEESTSDSQNDGHDAKQKRQNYDYDDHQLEGMTYKDLQNETWETEKHGRGSNIPQDLQDPTIPLSDRFQSCVELDIDKDETQEVQVEFFAKMSTAEWEEAGDLFIGRFAEIITKLKEARQAKRKIATDFEKLIEEREAVFRGKSEALDKDFEEMRKGGEGVIRGKFV